MGKNLSYFIEIKEERQTLAKKVGILYNPSFFEFQRTGKYYSPINCTKLCSPKSYIFQIVVYK